MSNRTAQANKAVNQAWINEQQLVIKGQGTRDWTPDQQRDILERGRAYDEDGRAFQGHHMKSVESYPEFQGDPGNIQFLTREEHKAAHFGDFHIPTNGYFDPLTGKTKDFGTNKYEPCPVITLTAPVITQDNKNLENEEEKISDNTESVNKRTYSEEQTTSNDPPAINKPIDSFTSQQTNSVTHKSLGGRITSFFRGAGRYIYTHRYEIIGEIVAVGGPIIAAVIDHKSSSRGGSNTNSNTLTSTVSSTSAAPSNTNISEIVDSISETMDKINRSSPIEHPVSGYDRMQNGKQVHVNPYLRGKKKDN